MCELISSILNFISHFIDDSATRLKKGEKRNDFNNKAFEFLNICLVSWGTNCKANSKKNQTVEECIDKFRQELIKNKIYMGWRNNRRFDWCVRLAKKHAFMWSNPHTIEKAERYQYKILKELDWLAQRTGREVEFNKIKNNYDY